jgi:hypothetical protein
MIFGPVSSVKGNRCIIVALVLTLTVGVFAGVATFVVPSEAAAPAPVDVAPVLVYGIGDEAVAADADAKSIGLRRREVAFNAVVLTSIVESKDADGISLDLFEDVKYVAGVERSSENLLGVKSFSGRLADRENGHLLMSVDEAGSVLLRVEALDEGLIYIIAQDPASGSYFVSEFRVQDLRAPSATAPRTLPMDLPVPDRMPAPAQPAVGDNVITDVLVVYTPAADLWARSNRTGIQNVLSQAFQRGNDTLEDSDVDMRLRLVHTQMVDYEESLDYYSDLDNLTFTESFNPLELDTEDFIPEAHTLRETYGADLVVLMNLAAVSDSGFAGMSWILMQEGGLPELGFSCCFC